MKRRWKIVIGVLAVLAVVLVVNAVTTGNQTKEARSTTEGGEILRLSRGDVQVVDSGPPEAPAPPQAGREAGRPAGQPIVLLHCYTCSLRWWDAVAEELADEHRVIRIDLLGHGGSEKPEAGYEIENQAAVVAEAMNELGVEGALVAGHSLGALVATSLAEQASQLVDRAVIVGMAPNTRDFGDGLPIENRVSRWPVIGEALWRVMPDFAIRDATKISFAPGYDVASGFSDPDVPVEDVRAMTYNSYDSSPAAADEFADELSLDERFRLTPVPLMVIMGAEDQIIDAERSVEGFADVPGVRTEIIDDAGHAPQVERPDEVAELVADFAVDLEPPAPQQGAQRPKKDGNAKAEGRKGGAAAKRKGASEKRKNGGRDR